MDYVDFIKEWHSDSEAIICHTSGSTGTPSRIIIPKKAMIESARRTCTFFKITPDSRLHSCISPDFIGGKMMYVRSAVSGANFSFEIPSNRPLSDHIKEKFDLVSVVPSQMIHILNHPEINNCCRNFLIGGSAIPTEIRERIIDNHISAFESYGMTETASHIALRKIAVDEEWFQTLPGISVFYHSENLLGIKIEGWKDFMTNDIAEIHTPKEFRIVGRADNVINTGGKKVFPEMIERKLAKHFKFPFFITSRPDSKWGEHIVLVSVDTNVSDKRILEICRAMLNPWEVPKETIRLPELPLTTNGKIKRIKFPALNIKAT